MSTPEHQPQPSSDAEWDERYTEADQVWSGEPNGALVTELRGRAPGRALDVGCGEGADAIWLAGQGWAVTGLDVSGVALDRAKALAKRADATVTWLHAGLLEADLPEAGYDLVSAQYAALRNTPDHQAERALVAAVAPGGLLLVVHHAEIDLGEASAHGFDPADYVSPADVAAILDERWDVSFEERRPRDISGGGGAHHHQDVVLRAERRA